MLVLINSRFESHIKFTGRKGLGLEDIKKLGGGYNPLLQSSLPEEFQIYKPSEETADSSHRAFTTTFPRGFAVEILQVYSGPPQIVYKFRHWAYMEGPFKGHAPTGELVEFYGMAIFGVRTWPRQPFIIFASASISLLWAFHLHKQPYIIHIHVDDSA